MTSIRHYEDGVGWVEYWAEDFTGPGAEKCLSGALVRTGVGDTRARKDGKLWAKAAEPKKEPPPTMCRNNCGRPSKLKGKLCHTCYRRASDRMFCRCGEPVARRANGTRLTRCGTCPPFSRKAAA